MTNENNNGRIIIEGVLSKGYGIMPKMITTDTNLTIEAKAIYAYMVSFAGAGETAFPKVSTMLYHLQISKTRYYKNLNLLKESGYIEVQSRRKFDPKLKKWVQDSNLYVIKQVIERNENNSNDNVNNIGNTNTPQCPQIETPQIETPQIGDTINNNSSTINSINNNSIVSCCCSEKETQLIDLYKSFHLEKRVMPHTTKLLKDNVDKFDIEVFEQIFINASSDDVKKKYAYIKTTLATLESKGIFTIGQYNDDQEQRKATKNKTKATGSSAPETKTTNGITSFKVKRNSQNCINETFRNYQPQELEKNLKDSQQDKFKNKDTQEVDMNAIRERAIDLLQERINADDSILFKRTVRLELDTFENEINEICNELLKS